MIKETQQTSKQLETTVATLRSVLLKNRDAFNQLQQHIDNTKAQLEQSALRRIQSAIGTLLKPEETNALRTASPPSEPLSTQPAVASHYVGERVNDESIGQPMSLVQTRTSLDDPPCHQGTAADSPEVESDRSSESDDEEIEPLAYVEEAGKQTIILWLKDYVQHCPHARITLNLKDRTASCRAFCSSYRHKFPFWFVESNLGCSLISIFGIRGVKEKQIYNEKGTMRGYGWELNVAKLKRHFGIPVLAQ